MLACYNENLKKAEICTRFGLVWLFYNKQKMYNLQLWGAYYDLLGLSFSLQSFVLFVLKLFSHLKTVQDFLILEWDQIICYLVVVIIV